MARFQTMDFGRAVQAGQNIRHNELRNRALGMEVGAQENIIRQQARAAELRNQFDTMPDQIQALEEAGMYDQANQMRDMYIRSKKNAVDLMRNMRPVLNPENYKQLRSELIQAGAVEGSMMPVEYSKSWLDNLISQQSGDLKKITRSWADQGATMSQDLVTQDGNIIWEGEPYKKDQKAGKPFKMEAADSNAIRRAAAALWGSMWDPVTGRYAGLDRDAESDVASVAEEASRIYNANEGRIPHNEAVSRAARRMGIGIRDLRHNPVTRDPANLGLPLPGAR